MMLKKEKIIASIVAFVMVSSTIGLMASVTLNVTAENAGQVFSNADNGYPLIFTDVSQPDHDTPVMCDATMTLAQTFFPQPGFLNAIRIRLSHPINPNTVVECHIRTTHWDLGTVVDGAGSNLATEISAVFALNSYPGAVYEIQFTTPPHIAGSSNPLCYRSSSERDGL